MNNYYMNIKEVNTYIKFYKKFFHSFTSQIIFIQYKFIKNR